MIPEPTPAAPASPAAPDADAPAVAAVAGGRGLLTSLKRVAGPAVFGGSLVIAAVVLWRQGNVDEVARAVRGADAPTIVAGMALYLVGLAMLCLRWHLLVRMAKGASDLPRASEAFLTSVVVNYYAPAKLAIPTRAALTMRSLGLTKTETAAVTLWEMAVDLVVLAVAGALWLATTRRAIDAVRGAGGGAIEALLGFLALVLVAVAGLVVVGRRRPELGRRIVAGLLQAARYPRQRPAEAARVLAVTVAFWVVQGAVLWVLLGALGERGIGLLLGLVSLPILLGMLSPLPGGLATREALMVAVAGVYGADANLVLIAALAYRIALFAAIPVLYVAIRVWLARSGSRGVGKPGSRGVGEYGSR